MKNISQSCYDLLKQIPKGKVTTYKILAQKLETKGYQAVGQIVGANPNAPQVPCHRVVKSDGSLGGYAYGLEKKIALLQQEKIEIIDGKVKNFVQLLYKF